MPYGGAHFRPFNAASTAGLALQSGIVLVLYIIGVLSCVYHLANGIWTMGITWGVWTSPTAQAIAFKVCGSVWHPARHREHECTRRDAEPPEAARNTRRPSRLRTKCMKQKLNRARYCRTSTNGLASR